MTDVYPQVPGQGGQKGKARRQERRLDLAGQSRAEVAGSASLYSPFDSTPRPLRVCPGAELRLTQLF